MLKLFKTLITLLVSLSLNAQIPLDFKNPSFEGRPTAGRDNTYLSGWMDCGSREFPEESSFDIQPGFFKVILQPKDGLTYAGLVTRANGSYESLCQELGEFLIKDSTYLFSIHLAKSVMHKSVNMTAWNAIQSSSLTKSEKKKKEAEVELVPFTENTILRVWGGTDKCSKDELLFTSKEISNTDWEEYNIEFIAPSNNVKVITFEAYYPDDSIFSRGNLMIDYIQSGVKK